MKNSIKLFLIPMLLGVLFFQSCEREDEPIVIDDCHDPKLVNPKLYENEIHNSKNQILPGGCYIPTPVCGCDGVTYGSEEEATYVYGIKKYTPGPCHQENECYDKSLIGKNPNQNAWMYYAPVCGCDGNTYINKDVAMYENGIKSFTKGACNQPVEDDCFDPKLVSNNPIPEIYAPVCGCNGVTYSNEYEAKNNGVKSFKIGSCFTDTVIVNKDCYDQNIIDKDTLIPAIYNPVCGCDFQTYSSPEEAKYYYGVKSYTFGPCEVIICEFPPK